MCYLCEGSFREETLAPEMTNAGYVALHEITREFVSKIKFEIGIIN